MIENLTLAREVQKAIDRGGRTLGAICRRTNRKPDQVGEALAYLMLTARTTRTEIRGNSRLYFPRKSQRARFDDGPLSFSLLRGLMPRARSITLTARTGDPTRGKDGGLMIELKLCAKCAALNCKCSQVLKACADCNTYTPIKSLIEKPDGREVCPTCQGRIERLAADRQQLDFFGQESLFN